MAMRCENCKKGIMVGRQHKHHPGVAGGRWKKRAPQTRKVFKPNLHVARVFADGAYRRMKLCTKCLRILKGKETLRQGSRQVRNKKEENGKEETAQNQAIPISA